MSYGRGWPGKYRGEGWMTLDDFLVVLRDLGRTWELDRNGAIRTADDRRDCPLTAVYHARCSAALPGHTYGWWYAWHHIGLTIDTALDIVSASELFGSMSADTRRCLLEACGINGEEGR